MNNLICIGSGNNNDREINDFYATSPEAIIELLKVFTLKNVWECACGQGHLAVPLKQKGILKRASDLVNRGYGEGNIDFLLENSSYDGDIVTNPPFKRAEEFVKKGMEILHTGRHLCLFLKLQFLESKGREKLFEEYPPKYVFVSRRRIMTAKNGDFNKYQSSALAYAWFVWEKGFIGEPVIKWFN